MEEAIIRQNVAHAKVFVGPKIRDIKGDSDSESDIEDDMDSLREPMQYDPEEAQQPVVHQRRARVRRLDDTLETMCNSN